MSDHSDRDMLSDLEEVGLDRDTMQKKHREFLSENLDGHLALINDLYNLADILHEGYEVGTIDSPFGSYWFGVISDAIDFIKEHVTPRDGGSHNEKP